MFKQVVFYILLTGSIVHAQLQNYQSPPTSYSFKIDSSEILQYPIHSFNDIFKYNTNIVAQDGNLHYRGGRSDEMGYYLNGHFVNNPLTNNMGLYIIPQAISKVVMFAQTTQPAFHTGNSGMVNVLLKKGGLKHRFSINVKSDKFVDEGQKFLGTNSYRDHYITATASGPIPLLENARYFIAYENKEIGDHVKRFTNAYKIDGLVDRNTFHYAIGDPVDIVNLSYLDGFTPGNSLKRNSINARIVLPLMGSNLDVNTVYSLLKRYDDNLADFNILNNRAQYKDEKQFFISANYTNKITEDLTWSLSSHYLHSFMELKDDYFGNDWESWSDSAKVATHTSGKVRYTNKWSMQKYILSGAHGFTRDGDLVKSNYYKDDNTQWAFNGALNYNLFKKHKLGLDFQYQKNVIRRFGVNAKRYSNTIHRFPVNSFDEKILRYEMTNWGYNLDGKENDSGFFKPKEPTLLNFNFSYGYNFSFTDIYFAFGVRKLDADNFQLVSDGKQILNGSNFLALSNLKEDSSPLLFLPRLQLTSLITKGFIVDLKIGKYAQNPQLSDIHAYNSIATTTHRIDVNYGESKAFKIRPVETFKMELSFINNQLWNGIRTKLTLFHTASKNLLHNNRQIVRLGSNHNSSYHQLISGHKAKSYGVDLNIKTPTIYPLRAELHYTFLNSKGVSSFPNQYVGLIHRGLSIPRKMHDLNFNVKHQAIAHLQYGFKQNAPFAFLNNSFIALSYKLRSGRPYSYLKPQTGSHYPFEKGVYYMAEKRSGLFDEGINNKKTKIRQNIDLTLKKTLYISNNVDITFYTQVINLLNTKNIENVYQSTGSTTDDGVYGSPEFMDRFGSDASYGKKFLDLYHNLNIKNGASYWAKVNKQLYGQPRQILMGMQITY